jgi:hypothetical protein
MQFRTLAFGVSALTLAVVPGTWAEEGKQPLQISPGAQRVQTNPPVDRRLYPACLEQEAAAAVKKIGGEWRTLAIDDEKKIAGRVFALCTSGYGIALTPFERWLYGTATETHVRNAVTALMRADTERRRAEERAQAERDAPNPQEKENAATHMYGECLLKNTRAIALVSTESAEIVREAAFAACREKRTAVLEVHGHYRDRDFSEKILDGADKLLAGKVLLEIIKMRAVPPSPERPPQAPHRESI